MTFVYELLQAFAILFWLAFLWNVCFDFITDRLYNLPDSRILTYTLYVFSPLVALLLMLMWFIVVVRDRVIRR